METRDANTVNSVARAWDMPLHFMEILVPAQHTAPLCYVCGKTMFFNPTMELPGRTDAVRLVFIGGTRGFALACAGHKADNERFYAIKVVS